MRIHVVVCVYVLFFASQLSLSRGEMAALVLAISGVMTAEALNTALEKFCDFTQKSRNRYIGLVKDLAAGAVLLSAIGALLVGVIVLFRPELWRLVHLLGACLGGRTAGPVSPQKVKAGECQGGAAASWCPLVLRRKEEDVWRQYLRSARRCWPL